MQELLKKSIEEGARLNDDQICDEVLGSRPGYVKGLGFWAKTYCFYFNNIYSHSTTSREALTISRRK